MGLTIEDLLNSLQSPEKGSKQLSNTADTWRRIGEKDSFTELGLDKTELEKFLTEWVNDNPYNLI